jgi:hypothetical protein
MTLPSRIKFRPVLSTSVLPDKLQFVSQVGFSETSTFFATIIYGVTFHMTVNLHTHKRQNLKSGIKLYSTL